MLVYWKKNRFLMNFAVFFGLFEVLNEFQCLFRIIFWKNEIFCYNFLALLGQKTGYTKFYQIFPVFLKILYKILLTFHHFHQDNQFLEDKNSQIRMKFQKLDIKSTHLHRT